MENQNAANDQSNLRKYLIENNQNRAADEESNMMMSGAFQSEITNSGPIPMDQMEELLEFRKDQ